MFSEFFLCPISFTKNLGESLDGNPKQKNFLLNLLKRRTIINLGCGEIINDDIRTLCIEANSEKYIGIDIQNERILPYIQNSITIEYVRADILDYLSDINSFNTPVAFIMFGIEPVNPQKERTLEYIHEMMCLISKISDNDDIILIGNGTHGIHPSNYSFRKRFPIKFDKFSIQHYVKKN